MIMGRAFLGLIAWQVHAIVLAEYPALRAVRVRHGRPRGHHPVSAAARAVTTAQMLLDPVVLGAVVRLLLDATQKGLARRAGTSGTADQRR